MLFDGELGGNPKANEAVGESGRSREERGRRATDFKTAGAIEIFREELLRAIGDPIAATRPTTRTLAPYQVTLMGHSMGTMVLNEWLRRDLLEQRKQFYANIVYMAAACTVRDFSRAVVPYLVQHRPDAKASDPAMARGTQFYNLMLHPLADLRERDRLFDLPPRGSLLVWLDSFLTDPQTPLDRTLGRWNNIIPATDLIPQSVRGQVTLKAFALAADDDVPAPGELDYGPQEHGQFRGKPYWCPEFWESEDAVICRPDCVPTTQPQ
jgi:pimeloyl-ACP methyl ester carboxylesterase